jgi:hypothetical protein
VHAVQGSNKGRFTAAGWANQGGDLVAWELQGDVLEYLSFAEPDVNVFGL